MPRQSQPASPIGRKLAEGDYCHIQTLSVASEPWACNRAVRHRVLIPMSLLQEQVPTPPLPPLPPVQPGQVGSITIAGPGGTTVIDASHKFTRNEVSALRRRRDELSNQLTSASDRRNRLANSLEDADGAVSRKGIEDRISQLDGRIMGIEADIAANGRLLQLAAMNGFTTQDASTSSPPPATPFGMSTGQLTGITIVGTVFVLFPIVVASAIRMLKRGSRQAAPAPSPESAQRMERLEQAVDAIAIEVERISEGQRFVTRLLTEGTAPALSIGQGSAEPVRVSDREPARASRGTA